MKNIGTRGRRQQNTYSISTDELKKHFSEVSERRYEVTPRELEDVTREEQVNWPGRSPDQNPFYFYLREQTTTVKSEEDLIARIVMAAAWRHI